MKLAQPQIPPKKRIVPARAWQKGGLGGIPPRPSEYKKRTAQPSCSFRAEPRTKVFFSFQKKKIGARKLKIVKKTFLRGGEVSERRRGWLPYWGFCSKNVRTSFKKHRQVLHSAKLKDVASAQSASAWYFSAILKAFLKSHASVRSAMRKFLCESTEKTKFSEPIFFLSPSAKG